MDLSHSHMRIHVTSYGGQTTVLVTGSAWLKSVKDMLPIKTHVLIHITKTQNKTRIQIRIQLVFLIYAIYVIFPQGNLKY